MTRRTNLNVQNQLPYRLFYFVCEDKESMQHYLTGLKRKYDSKKITIKMEKANLGNDAMSVWQSAKDKRDELKRQKDTYPKGFVVVACFDKDKTDISVIKQIMQKEKEEEEKFRQELEEEKARKKAEEQKNKSKKKEQIPDDDSEDDAENLLSDLRTIYNNPCYEYWLMLHVNGTNKCFNNADKCCHEARDCLEKKYRKDLGNISSFKNNPKIFEFVGKDIQVAIRNANSFNFQDYDNTFTNAQIVFGEIMDIVNKKSA